VDCYSRARLPNAPVYLRVAWIQPLCTAPGERAAACIGVVAALSASPKHLVDSARTVICTRFSTTTMPVFATLYRGTSCHRSWNNSATGSLLTILRRRCYRHLRAAIHHNDTRYGGYRSATLCLARRASFAAPHSNRSTVPASILRPARTISLRAALPATLVLYATPATTTRLGRLLLPGCIGTLPCLLSRGLARGMTRTLLFFVSAFA